MEEICGFGEYIWGVSVVKLLGTAVHVRYLFGFVRSVSVAGSRRRRIGKENCVIGVLGVLGVCGVCGVYELFKSKNFFCIV